MTTYTHPKHSSRSPRRTKATILASVTALITLCVVLVNPFGIDKAYALNDGRDVTWNVDQGAAGYSDMISAVSARVVGGPIYGSGGTTVDTTETNTNDYFAVDLASASNPNSAQLIVRGQNLYVQGYLMPGQIINGQEYLPVYYYFRDAAFTAYPSTSQNPVVSEALPFDGSYMGMMGASNETMQTPHFSSYWIQYNANTLANPNATNVARAGALMFFVEAIAEGTRFKAISDDIYNDLQATNQYYGYQFTSDDVGLVTNWAAIGNNFQQRLNNQNTTPYPNIGSYNFATLASTAAILALVLKYNS